MPAQFDQIAPLVTQMVYKGAPKEAIDELLKTNGWDPQEFIAARKKTKDLGYKIGATGLSEDLPELAPRQAGGAGEGANYKYAGLSLLTKDPEERARFFKEYPDAKLGKDKYGNETVEIRGKTYLLNKPGVSPQDIPSLFTQGAADLAVTALTGPASLLPRALMTGAGTAGVEAGRQALIGESPGGPGAAEQIRQGASSIALAGAAGAAGEPLADLLTLPLRRTPKTKIPLTRGQFTGDAKQLAEEAALRRSGALSPFENYQKDQLEKTLAKQGAVPAGEVGETIGQNARTLRRSMKSREEALWDEFRDQHGGLQVTPPDVDATMNSINAIFESIDPVPGVTKDRTLTPIRTPSSFDAVNNIRQRLEFLVKKDPSGNVPDVNVAELDSIRRDISTIRRAAKTPEDKMYTSQVEMAYDNWMRDYLKVHGHTDAVNLMDKARDSTVKLNEIFGDRSDVTRTMQRIAMEDPKLTGREIAGTVMAHNLKSTGDAVGAYNHIIKTFPHLRGEIQGGFIGNIVLRADGQLYDVGTMLRRIRTALSPDGMRPLAERVLEPEQIKELNAMASELEKIVQSKGAKAAAIPANFYQRIATVISGVAAFSHSPWLAPVAAKLGSVAGTAVDAASSASKVRKATTLPRPRAPIPTRAAAIEAVRSGEDLSTDHINGLLEQYHVGWE